VNSGDFDAATSWAEPTSRVTELVALSHWALQDKIKGLGDGKSGLVIAERDSGLVVED